MHTIDVIDTKLNEIANKIKSESKKIQLTHKQCEQMSKNLAKRQQKHKK